MSMNSAPPPSSLPLRCVDVRPYLSAYADGELAQPLRAQIAAHLETCEDCREQLARYGEIDAVLARLPRTAPSAAVFERIAAAVATHPNEPAVRESLNGRRQLHRQREVEVPQWGEETLPTAPVPGTRSRVPRWAAAGLPTVAAILLVAFTAVALRGLGARAPQATTPTVSVVVGDPVARTQSQIQTAISGKNMKFTAVPPTFVPGKPQFLDVSAQVIADPSGNGTRYLDVTWTLSGPVTTVHLREGPAGSEWYGYTSSTADGLTWQIGANQWAPLTPSDGSGRPAVGEQRDTMWLELDATVAPGSSGTSAAVSLLRQMSLSMDQPYHPLPVPQIIPPPGSSNLMFHLQGVLAGSGGTVEAYEAYNGVAQTASHVEVQTASAHFIDIISGQQGIRLDQNSYTYQQMPATSLIAASLDQAGAQRFYQADTDARSGLLWYVGPTTYNGGSAYDFLLVDAPNVTHVYVAASSKQVVAVAVDLASTQHPGGASAPSRFTNDGCIAYSLVELVPSSPGVSFATTPPGNYVRGAVPPSTVCSTGNSQPFSQ